MRVTRGGGGQMSVIRGGGGRVCVVHMLYAHTHMLDWALCVAELVCIYVRVCPTV